MNSKNKSIEMEEGANTVSQHTDGSQNQMNNSESSEKEELVTKVDRTPFHVISGEKGHIVVLGKTRMSDAFTTKEEAIEDAYNVTWERAIELIGNFTEYLFDNFKEKLTEELNKK